MKKNKRLAYMIRGEYRESRSSLHLLKLIHNILTKNNIDVDFYYLGWDNQLIIAYDNQLLGYRKQNKENIKSDFVKHGLNLVDIQLQEQPLLSPLLEPNQRNDTIQAQTYLSSEINKMRRIYMTTNDITYDYIYLTRMDFFSTLEYWKTFAHLWNDSNFDQAFSRHCWLLRGYTLGNFEFGGLFQPDFHFMGDEAGMNIFCNAFNHLYHAKQLYDHSISHGAMGAYINNRNLTFPDIMSALEMVKNQGELLRHGLDVDAILNAYTDEEILPILRKGNEDFNKRVFKED